MISFYLYEISRTGKSIDAESTLVKWGERRIEYGVFLWGDKIL
jgi:hypothetical protein